MGFVVWWVLFLPRLMRPLFPFPSYSFTLFLWGEAPKIFPYTGLQRLDPATHHAWRTLIVTPGELGADPLGGLGARLAEEPVLPELRAAGFSNREARRRPSQGAVVYHRFRNPPGA
jgi:hypothetical protein